MLTLQMVLLKDDLSKLLLKLLTVQEAGRLGSTCTTAYTLVQRGEAEEREQHQVFLPMWNTEHVLARLERFRQPFFANGGLTFLETTSLAYLLLDEMLPARVIELHFNLPAARDGQQPSLLGCHQLRVLDVLAWVQGLCDWAIALSMEDLFNGVRMRQTRRKHPGSFMMDMLLHLGLRPSCTQPLIGPLIALPEELGCCRCLCPRLWVWID
jgi:hypothetical protein